MSTAAPGSSAGAPKVSVVVPIYNVERYLRQCLESLAHQTMGDLEVVMVDDGSTDSSAEIAAAFADDDHRFVLVRQPNGGLGNARNTGADRARGQYLAFVDSDDVVTERAYELLAGTLDRTGSDFASGNFHRLTTAGTRQAGMVFTAFNAYRARTHVRKHPALLNDRTAWNKLFRRTFWDKHEFRWPEGVLYEDIPVTLRAHVLADAVDVVRDPVYLWRARSGDSTSITQRRVELRAIRDRYAAVDGVSRFLGDHDERALKRLYDKSVTEQDFRYFLIHIDRADDDFCQEFLRLVNDFFDRADPAVFDHLPALQRLEWHLVRRRLVSELREVVRFENSGDLAHTPFVKRGRRFYGDYPFRGDPRLAIPDDVFRLTKDELPMPARVQDLWWDGEVLHLSGFAYIAFLPLTSARAGRLRLTLEESGHAESVVPLDVRKVRRPAVTESAPDGVTNYDWAGWEASVPVSRLQHHGRFRAGTWRLRIEVKVDGVTRRRWVSATEPGRAMRYSGLIMGATRLTTTTPAGHFSLQVSTQHAQVERTEIDGDVLELSGTLYGRSLDPETAMLRLSRDDGTASHTAPLTRDVGEGDGVPFLTRIDLGRLRATEEAESARQVEDAVDGAVWELDLLPAANVPAVPLVAADDLPETRTATGSSETLLRVSRTGRVLLVDRTARPEVDEVAWQPDGTLALAAHYDVDDDRPRELVLHHRDRAVALAVPMSRDGDRVAARLDPAAMPSAGGPVQLATGRWNVFTRVAGGPSDLLRVKVARAALDALPQPHPTGWRSATVVDVEERSLGLDVKAELQPADRGRAARQRFVAGVFTRARRQPLADQVLVEGFGNGLDGEDVRAVLDALGARSPAPDVVWVTNDGLTPVPSGVRPVPRHGPAWHDALGRSRYVVVTDLVGLDETAPRPAQTVLQTWHGIPARPAGLDDERTLNRLGGADHIRREAARWDVVLSAGPAHTMLLRSAFGVDGAIVETGLPRHDLLVDPTRAEERAARKSNVRQRLGVPGDRRVVLWAPSYRPREEVTADRYPLDLRADPAAVAAALGDEHVLVVRPHPKVLDTVAGDARQVLDGFWFPDVRDLLLVADVVVTDRCALLFDVALTGTPTVFFDPDLDGPDAAEDDPAGRYLSPSALPGRVVTDARELAPAVVRAHDDESTYTEARSRLLATWLPIRDGKATARAVEALLRDPIGSRPSPTTPAQEDT